MTTGIVRDTASLEEGEEAPEDTMPSETAWSAGERLRGRAFDRMSPAELREAERLIDRMVLRMPMRRTRRWKLHRRGTPAGAAPDDAPQPGHRRRSRRVALAAPRGATPGSGPAVRHQRLHGAPRPPAAAVLPRAVAHGGAHRGVLLRHAADAHHAPAAAPRPGRGAGPDLARRSATGRAARASGPRSTSSTSAGRGGCCAPAASCSWSATAGTGATRARWGRRRPDCAASATGSSGSTRWQARPGYKPLAAGMAAAWPHIDVFLPSHDLGSLELLAGALADDAGARTGTTLR